jgi:signal transduction histidine kinase
MDLVAQFMSIHAYFSFHKVSEMHELIELKQDERMRMDNEQQKVYVRNQIMDNSLSTLKHETMYYPNRIKQLVDAALATPDKPIDEATIADIDELMTYYKDIFTILSTCAGKQVEIVLFKRTKLSAQTIGEMATRSFKKWQKKMQSKTSFQVSSPQGIQIQGDKIFLQTLIDQILSLYVEHHSGGDLRLDVEASGDFVQFAFTDTAYRYAEEEIPQLFYIDNVKYDAKSDTLSGAQYMISRQIIREHDAYSPHRGCRIYVENTPDGRGSSFIFTLPKI